MRLGVLLFMTVMAAASWFTHGSLSEEVSWAIVLDCGSTGTRLHMYRVSAGSGEVLSEFTPPTDEDLELLKVEPGISDFVTTTAELDAYLSPLLLQAARWIPAEHHAKARIRALATAGMRMLPTAAQRRIWAALSAAIVRHTTFDHRSGDTMTISGEFEGIFILLAVSHMLGRDIAGLGALDMGGASSQISFAPPSDEAPVLADAYHLTRDGTTSLLYSHSYMRSGESEGETRVAELLAADAEAGGRDVDAGRPLTNPCYNRGYSQTVRVPAHPAARPPSSRGANASANSNANAVDRKLLLVGSGDWEACRALTLRLVHLDYECTLAPCALQGVYQPSPAGVTFYATSGFFFVANGLGLAGWDAATPLSWRAIAEAGEAYCARPWAEIADEFTMTFCFQSAFVATLLEAFAIPADDATQVRFARELGGYEVAWALGAQVYFGDEERCQVTSALPSRGLSRRPLAAGSGQGAAAARLAPRAALLHTSSLAIGLPASLLLGCVIGALVALRSPMCARWLGPKRDRAQMLA